MRNIRWGSPTGIALIGVGGSIAAAVIGGVFTLVVALQDSTVILPGSLPAGDAESKFLGEGFAKVEGPHNIVFPNSARVTLDVSLDQTYKAKDVIWQATPSDQPAVKAGPVSTFENILDAELPDVLIYKEMRARLDAPGFSYENHGWDDKNSVLGDYSWEWIIKPLSVGPQAITVHLGGPREVPFGA